MKIEQIVMPENSRRFSGDNLLQIAMPMGGMGGGCVSLNGHGGLQDISIRHQPATTALPDGHGFIPEAFAVLNVRGQSPVTRLLEGPMPVEKVYDQGLMAQGYRRSGHEGLPRFESSEFAAAFPFGEVRLRDDSVPLGATITGWSPLIPLDDRSASMPCAVLEYTLHNQSERSVEFDFTFAMAHWAVGASGEKQSRNLALPGLGIHFTNAEEPLSETFGSACLAVVGHAPKIKAMWFRGGWFDSISVLWSELTRGEFSENDGHHGSGLGGRNGGAIQISGRLEPGQSVTYPIVLTWHFPNVYTTSGAAAVADVKPRWRPYYAGQWSDAAAVARDVATNFESLRSPTLAFRDALYETTAGAEVVDAVASNLAILKSPTILRQENGNLWAWEGCFTEVGCCPGSCTHVWNYAQAIGHLFPRLERGLREQELKRSMDETGHVTFRSALPDGPTTHDFHPAADGQLGGILKLFREWQISGDTAWLREMYPLAERSLNYCIQRWDPDRRGAPFEPHHNTYDIEFWGPDGMCGSIYVAALSATARMAEAVGHSADAKSYDALATVGAAFLSESLFNGEYFSQKVLWKELRDQSFQRIIDAPTSDNPEMLKLLRAEGPKYQYGNGCLSDGVIGAWMAKLYGVDTPINAGHVRSTLASIFKYNFKKDLFSHACLQRPGYAIGHEPGLLLCSWPKGAKPALPFVYSDEVWTGIEYQVASHLIAEGMVEEGLTIVRAVRGRYEGHVRNPFNEYECGSFYARALASYALLQSISGFSYSAVTRVLRWGPRINQKAFRTFFSTASGWGTASQVGDRLIVHVIEGELTIDHIECGIDSDICRLPRLGRVMAGERREVSLAGRR
jgi:uncharacterized protein (DUF608 family)